MEGMMARRELTETEYRSIWDRLEKEANKRFPEGGWSIQLDRITKEDGTPKYAIMRIEERE